ncbi:PIR protein [Plasmodium brasilianum]|uniref:PIR protein n=1 Tax=Plasmodium brasilianum TaxID=5824 RepID=A0ACB9Y5A8_PLABR|nr:PIR protein [Plasmodium brasilianum]
MENITDLLHQHLEESPSSNIYNKFNNNVNGNQYDEICKECNDVKDDYPTGSYDLCKKIARNAEDLSLKKNKEGYNSHCLHYTYWVYYKIKKILELSHETNKPKHLVNFLKVRSRIYNHYSLYKCLPEIEKNTIDGLNEKVDEKYLFDYFEYYDNIKTYNTCIKFTFEKYKKYLNHIKELYKKDKNTNECCDDSFWDDCDMYFKCNKEFDPNTLLSSLNDKQNNNCDILKTLDKSSESSNSLNSQGSQRDFKDSIYFLRCTDNMGDSPEDTSRIGGKINCYAFPASRESLNKPTSPYYLPPLHGDSSTTTTYGSKNSESVLIPSKGMQQSLGATTNGVQGKNKEGIAVHSNLNSRSNALSSLSMSLDPKKYKITPQFCQIQGLVKSSEGVCREPSVRDTPMIGAKWNIHAPQGRVKYSPEIISVLFRNSDKSNIFSNNIFRVGIACTLIVGIISTIYIYYKFTPFGRGFHKKVPRKKRIDDYYYDDPHIRHFVIRAPKSVKRKVGSRRLHFSYYSR